MEVLYPFMKAILGWDIPIDWNWSLGDFTIIPATPIPYVKRTSKLELCVFAESAGEEQLMKNLIFNSSGRWLLII